MPRLDVGNAEVEFEVVEPVSAVSRLPLVLIHGFPLDRRVWRDVAAVTGRKWRTICPDLPGFGRSSGRAASIEALARNMHGLLSRLEALPAAVAGLSMGGYVSLEMARQFPEAVAALALVDSRASGDDEAGKEKRQQTVQLVRDSGGAVLVDQMLPNLLSPYTLAHRPEMAQRLRRIMLDVPAQTLIDASLAMRDRRDQQELLAGLTMPVAVIVGADDRITPPSVAEQMATAAPQGKLTVIPNAGHMAALEQPEAVAAALEKMMQSLVRS